MDNDIFKYKTSKEWIEFDKYCNSGLFNQIDFFRYEDMHTNFLASLFKEENIFRLGTTPLKRFIELLKIKETTDTSYKLKNINLLDDTITKIETLTQVPTTDGRIDLLIKFVALKIDDNNNVDIKKYNLIIENKLFGNEGINQTKKYQEHFEKVKNDKEENIYIYLSLSDNPSLSSDNSEFRNYIKISYQNLIDFVLEPCSVFENKGAAPISIDEYLKSFTFLAEYDLMPMTNNVKTLALAICSKYKDVLLKILDSIEKRNKNEYYCFYTDNSYTFRILFSSLKDESFIGDKIKKIIFGKIGFFDGKTYSTKQQTLLVRKVLADLIKTKTITKLGDLNDIKFSEKSTWEVAITENEYNKKGIRQENYEMDKEMQLEGKMLYYSFPVRRDELKGFVDCIKNKYPKFAQEKKLELFIDSDD